MPKELESSTLGLTLPKYIRAALNVVSAILAEEELIDFFIFCVSHEMFGFGELVLP